MEKTERIVKVYSNTNKKSRLKRRKNKFQRIWDAEKQTYVKVRKAKYPVINKTRKDWREIDNSKAIKRRTDTVKKPKSVPVNAAQMSQKPAALQKPEKKVVKPATHAKADAPKAVTINIFGKEMVFDKKTLRYREAA